MERHLVLQELTLRPSGEWVPRNREWFMVRVAEGVGYWLQPGAAARQLGVGDGLVTTGNRAGVIRASQLGELKLQFFVIQPQYLNGLLTVAEWHQLEVSPQVTGLPASLFTADQPLAQRFTRLAELPRREGLTARCALLQLWAGAIADLLPAPAPGPAGGGKLRERFRQLVGRMPEAELSQCSLRDLSGQLNCSERHFTRLFREEFGVPFRARQIELRLQRARQLLADSEAKIINVAYDSGYQHLGLFNMMFKKRFGMTPSEWRRQNQRKCPSPPAVGNFLKPVNRIGLLLFLLVFNFISPAIAQTNSNPAVGAPSLWLFPGGQVLCLLLFLSGCGLGLVSRLSAAELPSAPDGPRTASAASTPDRSSPGPRFNVRAYAVKSSTLLPTNVLERTFSPHTGTNVSLEDIASAAADLQAAYRDRGYPSMCIAVAPEQITNGIVTMNVFQAAVPQILISGWRYAGAGEPVPAATTAAAITNAVPPVAATNVVTVVTNFPAVAVASPEAVAQARAALYQKFDELEAQEKDTRIHVVSTNAGPRFDVAKYLILGNTVLPPEAIGMALTNIDGAFGTNVSFDGVRAVLKELQSAYLARGYVTVSVGLPQQKLTNATVKVQVIEGRLAAINVTGNRYYSSNNVMRALPDLYLNMLLNSRVLQSELDQANASRDRQIYPVVGPGPEPGTSELTLKVKDQLPLHARVELNNQGTPGTPDLRTSFNSQYDNLWGLEHQVGLQYGFSPEQMKSESDYQATPLDDPLIANYSGYYRLPLGGYNQVQQQVDANPGSFGYNEITHRFNLPPATGRPELNFYASRSTSDTGVQLSPLVNVVTTPLVKIDSQNAGDNVTLNEGSGGRLTVPLPPLAKVNSTLSLGVDYKRYQEVSYNTNNFYVTEVTTNSSGQPVVIKDTLSSGQPKRVTTLIYVPFNVGLSGSVVDPLGTTFFNSQVNFNVLSGGLSDDADFGQAAYSTNARAGYVTVQTGADRVQTLYQDWSVKLHADGQWANTALVSNEQYPMGGSASVRGYQDGQAYGDTGWRFSIEPQTPLFNVGRVGNEGRMETCWVRASVFLDYGQIYDLESNPAGPDFAKFCGTGFSFSANIGSHLDGRVTVAWPLISHENESDGVRVYFGVGAQF